MKYEIGTELHDPRYPDKVFVVESEEYAVRAFGPPKLNHVDLKAYCARQYIHLPTGSSYILEPAGRPR